MVAVGGVGWALVPDLGSLGKMKFTLPSFGKSIMFLMNRISLHISALILVVVAQHAVAHQPVLVTDTPRTREQPYEIEEPEISKAIYSELTGSPHFYQIHSDTRFNFYEGLTKPKLDDCQVGKKFSFDVLDEAFALNNEVDSSTFEWWPWYEKFGRQWYWVSPEIGKDFQHTEVFDAGTYYIRVYNESNQGQYVLAVGDIESFGVGVVARMVRDLLKINRKFCKNASCDS